VLSPALGGLIIGHEVGRGLDVRAIFAERQDGALMLRRGFVLSEADRVLVIEDVVTTGGSTRETMQVATAAGGHVVGAASIVDRSGGRSSLSGSGGSVVWPAVDIVVKSFYKFRKATLQQGACRWKRVHRAC